MEISFIDYLTGRLIDLWWNVAESNWTRVFNWKFQLINWQAICGHFDWHQMFGRTSMLFMLFTFKTYNCLYIFENMWSFLFRIVWNHTLYSQSCLNKFSNVGNASIRGIVLTFNRVCTQIRIISVNICASVTPLCATQHSWTIPLMVIVNYILETHTHKHVPLLPFIRYLWILWNLHSTTK